MSQQSASSLTVFVVIVPVAWILTPLKKIKPAFIVGIIFLVLGLIGLFANPSNSQLYRFSNRISVAQENSFFLDGRAFIYFSYKSYEELSRADFT
jgi:hypothetical protein